MEFEFVSPDKLQIDSVNERSERVGPQKNGESLEESIESQGIIQPPIVRENGDGYKVVVGQRRTLAAQSVGLEEVPVVVVDWNDSEALLASITENVEAFQKEVSRKDRAAAIRELMEISDSDTTEIADQLGVNRRTISKWLERTRDEWEDTVVHVDEASEGPEEVNKNIDNISEDILAPIRTQTESREEREEIVETVAEENLSREDVRKARKEAERGDQDFKEVIEKKSQSQDEPEGSVRVRTETTFSGDYAEGLIAAAEDRGTTEEDIVKDAIKLYLSEEGYI